MEIIEYEGYEWVLIKGYFTRDDGKKRYLYEWEKHNGKIPKGYVIHHLDGNSKNDDISNLECITKEDHNMIHKNNMNKNRIGKTYEQFFGEKRANEIKEKISRASKNISKETREKFTEYTKQRWLDPSFKEKMRQIHHNRIRTDQEKDKIRQKLKGRQKSDETKKKISEAKIGKKMSEQTKEKLRKIYLCPHCGKEGIGVVMFRHHFNNCKQKQE